jgi:hypothetical protein
MTGGLGEDDEKRGQRMMRWGLEDDAVGVQDDAVGFLHATDSICAIIYIGQPWVSCLSFLISSRDRPVFSARVVFWWSVPLFLKDSRSVSQKKTPKTRVSLEFNPDRGS